MAFSEDFLGYVLDQLRVVPGVSSRKMFGGLCLFHGGRAFGLIDSDDVFYLKVDESNRADYESAGMKPFAPFPDKPQYIMSYYEVPAEVLEDRDQLKDWSRKSILVAQKVNKKPAAKKRKKP
jgi:DNA transformation protein